MATELISNVTHEPCNHGWIHTDRASSYTEAASLPDPTRRRTSSIRLSLQSPETLFDRGLQLTQAQQYKEAIRTFRSAIQLRWSFTAAYVEAGNCASLLNDFELALDFYKSAIDTDPFSPIPLYNIGLTHVDLGNSSEAISSFEQTINVDPKYRSAYIHLAQQHASFRRHRLAISLLIKAAYIEPYDAGPLVAAGNLYFQNTLEAEAVRCFERAIKVDAWNSSAYFHLGFAQWRKGDFPRAARSLSFALNCDPKNKIAAALLRRVSTQLKPKTTSTAFIQETLFADSLSAA